VGRRGCDPTWALAAAAAVATVAAVRRSIACTRQTDSARVVMRRYRSVVAARSAGWRHRPPALCAAHTRHAAAAARSVRACTGVTHAPSVYETRQRNIPNPTVIPYPTVVFVVLARRM